MSAGTVISGGFPGRVAQEVQPNPKCGGCLHYDGQAGRTGACTIGLRPWLCGDGEAQDIGYAPITRGAGSYLPEMANHATQAPEVETQFVSNLYGSGSTRPVQVQQVSLGAEHVHIVKSMFKSHVETQQSMCRLCKSRGTIGTGPANNDPQVCTCEPIAARDIAKALVPRMSNAQRMSYDLDELTAWVHDVAKAGFKVPKRQPSPARSTSNLQLVKSDHSGGHLVRRDDAIRKSIAVEAVDKSYNDDWLCQFKGTPMFKEAHALCEQELEMQEAQLKRRLESAKRDKARSAALAKLERPSSYDWQEADATREHLSIAKQRLTLKLAEHQQKAIAKGGDLLKSERTLKWKHGTSDGGGFSVAEASHGTYHATYHKPSELHTLQYTPHGGKQRPIANHPSERGVHAAADYHHANTARGLGVKKE